ncbi:MAG: hypothetical protein HRT52_19965 [Colwellia sp.]|nr:hypothetical protein [Colwellia sp.]NQZ83288.1 hypothetical protein [Colwellia sp.]
MRSNRDGHIIIHNDVLNNWKANNSYHDDCLFYAIRYLMKRFYISHRNAMTLLNSKFSFPIKLPSHSTVHKRIEELALVDTDEVDKYFVITSNKAVSKRYKGKIDGSASQAINFSGKFKERRISFESIDKGFLIKKERQIKANKKKGTLTTKPIINTTKCLITKWFKENKQFVQAFYLLLNPENYSHYFDLLSPLFKRIKGAKSITFSKQQKIIKDTIGSKLASVTPKKVPLHVQLIPFEIIHTIQPSQRIEHRLSLILWINCGHSGQNFVRFLPLDMFDINELNEIEHSIKVSKGSHYIKIELTVDGDDWCQIIPYDAKVPPEVADNKPPEKGVYSFTPTNTINFGEGLDGFEIIDKTIDSSLLSISSINKSDIWTSSLSEWVIHLNHNAEYSKSDKIFYKDKGTYFSDDLTINLDERVE